jgi:uncharacterized YigZ family protein
MLFDDTYRTVADSCETTLREKGSKFIGCVIPVTSEGEVKSELDKIRKLHPSANHHCYAYRLGAAKLAYRYNDDGEPAGTAGRPIYGQIQSADLTNILIVVVRYFGGTLLGVSGLIKAYREAAAMAIGASEIETRHILEYYELKFDYSSMEEVMKLLKASNATIEKSDFDLSCSLVFSVRRAMQDQLLERLSKLKDVRCTYSHTL